MDKAAREKARERQPFERFPTLAASIAHLGFRVTGISLQDWNEHLAQINARLMSAAPDLHAALHKMLTAYDFGEHFPDDHPIVASRAALNKANF